MRKAGLIRKACKTVCISVCILLMFFSQIVNAYVPYRSFHYITYQNENYTTDCPAPFLVERVVSHGFSSPGDLCIGADGKIYLADTGNSRIMVLDQDGNILETITGVNENGTWQPFQSPEGVFAAENGHLYIADTENSRVVELDGNRQLVKSFTAGQNDIFGEGYIFYPRKIAVDSAGRIFVAARGQVNGIMQFTPDGQFTSFVGSNRVVVSPLDILWRQLMTKEQREKTMQFIPLEYSNLYVDGGDFIYAVTQATNETKKVKRLNPGGVDILPEADNMSEITEESKITCICADEDGNFYYADQNTGCVYVFQSDGSMLYAFGGKDDSVGNFSSPSAIRYDKDRLYVLDSLSNDLTVLSMTDYAKNIRDARRAYQTGKYDQSLSLYQQVLRQDSNYELAYIYMGRIYYQKEDYQTAMKYFQRGNYRGDDVVIGYGKALEQYQRGWLRSNLHILLPCVIVAAAGGYVLVRWYLRRKSQKGGRNRASQR